jgi:hypothetical protein
MAATVTVELGDANGAEQLVRYLDEREVESAKRVDCDDVVIRMSDEPRESRFAVLVALEGWLARQRRPLLVLREGRRRHRLRPYPDAMRS